MSDVASVSTVLSTVGPTLASQLLEYVCALLALLLSGFASWLMPKICAWIDTQTHGTALESAGAAAEAIIMAVEQETVKSARAACDDGRMTKDELNKVFSTAKETAAERFLSYIKLLPKAVQPLLTQKANALLEAALGSLKARGLIPTSLNVITTVADTIPAPPNPSSAPASK